MRTYRVILLDLQEAPDHLAGTAAEDLPRLYAACTPEERSTFFTATFAVPEDLPVPLIDLIGRGLLYTHHWCSDGTVTAIIPAQDNASSPVADTSSATHRAHVPLDPEIIPECDRLRPALRSLLMHGHQALADMPADLDENDPVVADALKHLALRVARLETVVAHDFFRCHLTGDWYPKPTKTWTEGTIALRAHHRKPFFVPMHPLEYRVAAEDWEEHVLAAACAQWGDDWVPSCHDATSANDADRRRAVLHAILRATTGAQQQAWIEECTQRGYDLPQALLR